MMARRAGPAASIARCVAACRLRASISVTSFGSRMNTRLRGAQVMPRAAFADLTLPAAMQAHVYSGYASLLTVPSTNPYDKRIELPLEYKLFASQHVPGAFRKLRRSFPSEFCRICSFRQSSAVTAQRPLAR